MSAELIYMQKVKSSDVKDDVKGVKDMKEKCYICEKEIGTKPAITILTQIMHVECVVNAVKFYKENYKR